MVNTEPAARFALWPLPDLGMESEIPFVEQPGGAAGGEGSYEEGFEAGYAQGRAEMERSVGELAATLQDAITQLESVRTQMITELQQYAVDLAMGVARHIVQREVVLDDRIVLDSVKRILDTVAERRPVRIRLNPDDLEAGENHRVLEDWTAAHEWIADASMDRGSCVVESPGRVVDGTIDSILHDLTRRLIHD